MKLEYRKQDPLPRGALGGYNVVITFGKGPVLKIGTLVRYRASGGHKWEVKIRSLAGRPGLSRTTYYLSNAKITISAHLRREMDIVWFHWTKESR